MSTAIRIFVVEDMPSMRERLIEFLNDIDGVNVVGAAGTPDDAIDAILETRPDLVLLDYQLDGGTGLDVLRAVHGRAPAIHFAVLTQHATSQHRRACFKAGARVFFDKATEFGKVREFIAEFRESASTAAESKRGEST